MSAARHLAQFNIARIKYPLDDPRMREFVDNVARVNALAEAIDGFIWRLQDESGNAMNMKVYDDPRVLPNLTLWENVEALERFVWQTVHKRFYGRREEWFEPIETPLVLWFVPAGHKPTMAEGVERLDHLIEHGASDYAFGWDCIPAALHWKTARCGAPTTTSKYRSKRACGMTLPSVTLISVIAGLGRDGLADRQPAEQQHVLGKQESEVP